MPIRELTENPRIPRLGKIRTGKKVPTASGGERPLNTDYFVCPPEVQAIYGEEPRELKIVFLTNDLEHIANQYYRAYNRTNGLICKGDGFTADALLDGDAVARRQGDVSVLSKEMWSTGQSKKFHRAAITCLGSGYEGQPPCPMFVSRDCRRTMTLEFAIEGVPGLGVYTLSTGSINSVRNINGTIELITQLAGGIAGAPLRLVRTQQTARIDNKQTNVWVIDLKCDLPLTDLIKQVRAPAARALLPPPDELDAEPEDEGEQEHAGPTSSTMIDLTATVADESPAISPDQLHAITASIPELRKMLPPAVMTDFLFSLSKAFSNGKGFKPNALTAAQAADVLNRIRAIADENTETDPQAAGEAQQPALDVADASTTDEGEEPGASASEESETKE